jgi:hypothetical protein
MKKENIIEIFKNLSVRAQKAGILNLEEVPYILQALEVLSSLEEPEMQVAEKEPQIKK